MLDGFLICSATGIVLFEKRFIQLRTDPFADYINQAIIEKRPLRQDGSFAIDPYALSSLIDHESQLCFIACWQKSLQLGYINNLLTAVRKAFLAADLHQKALVDGDFDLVQQDFDMEFLKILRKVEDKDKEERQNKTQKTFEQTKKFQQTVEGTKQADAIAMGRQVQGGHKKKNKPAKEEQKKKPGKSSRKWDDKVSNDDLAKLDFSGADGDIDQVPVPTHLVDNAALEKMKQAKTGGNIDVLEMDGGSSEDDDDDTSDSDSSQSSGWFGFMKNFSTQKTITKETLEPVLKAMNEHLVKKNVAKEIADHLCSNVEETLLKRTIGTFDSITKLVKQSMEDAVRRILTPSTSTDLLRDIFDAKQQNRPYTVTFIGVNGVGKSTNLSKTCFWLLQNKLSVLIAACDTFRSGAVEQLNVHVRNLKKLDDGARIELYQKGYGKDAAAIAQEAIAYASKEKFDVVMIDTAGRMQDNEPLMRALSKLVAVNNPDKIIFVGEALVGNDAVDQLTKFNQALKDFSGLQNPRQIDGIILSKFDTVDDKVGAALSMTYTTGKPVLFVGTGQTYMDLKKMNIKYIVETLLNPVKPSEMDWSVHYPEYFGPNTSRPARKVEFADIGCGYGGLMVDMAKLYPDQLMLGMEIRVQVSDYVHRRILALRGHAKNKQIQGSAAEMTADAAADEASVDMPEDHGNADYQNISVLRMNAMKFLPNFFEKGQLSKIFFLFPDPHFKKKKHKARIITKQLLAEYAYVLKHGGILYTCTDVKDLHDWMVAKIDSVPELFERISEEEAAQDPVTPLVMQSTEEGKKVARNNGSKYFAAYRRIVDPEELVPLD